MSIMDEVHRLARSGKIREGIALVERAAAGADAEAQFALANWRLWGLYGPRDLQAAHHLLEQAEAHGSREAILLRATLIGNGTGTNEDPRRARQMLEPLAGDDPALAQTLSLLDQLDQAEAPQHLQAAQLCDNPEVRLVRSFLPAEICRWLIARAQPLMGPSMIIDETSGRPRPHPVRTSSSMNFDPSEEDILIRAVNRRIAALTGTDVRSGEPLHVLHYAPGQEFRPHLDAIAGAENQRRWTVLVWLNDGYEGGETVFPDVGVSARGEVGDALIFRNDDEAGRANPLSRHAGVPVTSGAKWIASRWIRQHPYDPEILR